VKGERPTTPADVDLTAPSWYFTERVAEALVQMSKLASGSPLRSERLTDLAGDLLAEAEQLVDQELLSGSEDAGPSMRNNTRQVRADLRRARAVLSEKPGTSAALALDVLRNLDRLAAARQDAANTGLT
jgi:hypothetical protein